MIQSPFTEAERALQTRVGVRDKIEAQGQRVMRDFLPQQHQDFYRLLPFIAMSSVDSSGRNWCQVVAGPPGFVDTSNNRLVRVNSLPFAFELVVGAPVGVLGIQLSTRRRNKFKGVISRVGDSFFDIAVLQTVGNCPQYIFSRDAVFAPPLRSAASSDSRVVMSRELNDEAVKLISSCDFFFLGTVQADRKAAEVNHRGGKAGFVKVLSRTQLVFPDFTGNFHFSSLGNIESTGLCSAIFIDVNTSETLLITCKASIDWDSELVSAFAGAERLVKMEVIEVARPLMPLPLRFQGGEPSSILSRTGDWNAAEKSLEAAKTKNAYRPFVLKSCEPENQSGSVLSLVFEPNDKGGVPSHVAGAFLPIRINGHTRTYTVSDCANNSSLRLSVKRDGVVSKLLHDLAVGDVIEALAPRGDFVFRYDSRRPVVFAAAGVGITPFVAMINEIFINEGRTRHHQNVFLFHSVRSLNEAPFLHHLLQKQQLHHNFHYVVCVTGQNERFPNSSVFHPGRLSKELLQSRLPLDLYDVYLCGPSSFQQSAYDLFLQLGCRDKAIYCESFGPSSLKRARKVSSAIAAAPGNEEAVVVHFQKSNVKARWTSGSLLELAEQSGLNPMFSCRSGICGTCAVKCVKGKVEYFEEPMAQIADVEDVLICCSKPKPGAHVQDGSGVDREGVTLDL